MTKPRKYANDYPNSFIPTYTWNQAQANDRQREEARRKKIKRRRSFTVMGAWQRFYLLSIEKPKNFFWRSWTKIKLPRNNTQ